MNHEVQLPENFCVYQFCVVTLSDLHIYKHDNSWWILWIFQRITNYSSVRWILFIILARNIYLPKCKYIKHIIICDYFPTKLINSVLSSGLSFLVFYKARNIFILYKFKFILFILLTFLLKYLCYIRTQIVTY